MSHEHVNAGVRSVPVSYEGDHGPERLGRSAGLRLKRGELQPIFVRTATAIPELGQGKANLSRALLIRPLGDVKDLSTDAEKVFVLARAALVR
jgi:hypothetical protein